MFYVFGLAGDGGRGGGRIGLCIGFGQKRFHNHLSLKII